MTSWGLSHSLFPSGSWPRIPEVRANRQPICSLALSPLTLLAGSMTVSNGVFLRQKGTERGNKDKKETKRILALVQAGNFGLGLRRVKKPAASVALGVERYTPRSRSGVGDLT